MTDATPNQELLFFNGINGDSGEYDLPPMTGKELSSFIQGEGQPENLNELRFRFNSATGATYGLREGLDPLNLAEAGWGVIFHSKADPSIQAALQELLDLRHSQAGDHFRLYAGPDGYRQEESKSDFLARHGAGPGPADPDKVPYYLLIVGGPAEIPYQFQSQLDVQYAVGRIYFDSLGEYASYARSVVTAESGQVKLARQAVFFGTSNPDDRATQLSAEQLVTPLSEKFQAEKKDWNVQTFLAQKATKAQLSNLLGGEQTPALLFSASHGMSYPLGSSQQEPFQGALLCQDWPGPNAWRGKGIIPQDFFFAGQDLSSDASLLGTVAFFFACYGAGTPLNDAFSKQAFRQRTAIAKAPFISQLPMKMLAHPRGGALAVIGHVERAWGYSFSWPKAGQQTTVFESTLERLMKGQPVGCATEFFNERYAELATVLSDTLENIDAGQAADPYELAGEWTANNDARGYTVLGDPAVRLPLVSGEDPSSRPAIESIHLVSTTSTATASGPAQTTITSITTAGIAQAPPPGSAPTPPAQAFGESAVEFGLVDNLSDMRTRLTTALQQFAENLGKTLAKAVDDAATLQVATYTLADMSSVPPSGDFPPNAQLRAYTRIRIDGDTQVIVPQDAGEIDRNLWSLHLDMVEQAQANRTEMIKAAASAATGLLQALKVI